MVHRKISGEAARALALCGRVVLPLLLACSVVLSAALLASAAASDAPVREATADSPAAPAGISPAGLPDRQRIRQRVGPFFGPPWFLPTGPAIPPELLFPRELPQPGPFTLPLPRPQRVLLIGDSLMQNGCLGSRLEARFEGYRGVSVCRWALQSTGLSRLDYFDVPGKLAGLLDQHHPDLVVAIWGANDCQSLTSARGKVLATFGTDAWDAGYGSRVRHVVELVHEAGGQMVLIGLPNMRSQSYAARIARLNGVVEKAAREAGGVYLPTWGVTSNGAGGIRASVAYCGKTKGLRQKDGIHLSNHGAAYVSDWLCAELEKLFVLEKPQQAVSMPPANSP
jgi:hypothetical protein